MRVIPVIDLQGGCVVRGIAGRREEYRPIQSRFAIDARPVSIARGLRDEFGFADVYVADLDAIAGGQPSWPDLRVVSACGLNMLLDTGAANEERARSLAELARELPHHVDIVVGLESVESEDDLAQALDYIGPQNAVFSLDLRAGTPVSRLAAWRSLPGVAVVDRVVRLGFERVIVLDLAQVGMNSGLSVVPLCRVIRESHPRLGIISGGGVRGLDDLRVLADCGCDAALVASALHDGKLSRSDIETAAAF